MFKLFMCSFGFMIAVIVFLKNTFSPLVNFVQTLLCLPQGFPLHCFCSYLSLYHQMPTRASWRDAFPYHNVATIKFLNKNNALIMYKALVLSYHRTFFQLYSESSRYLLVNRRWNVMWVFMNTGFLFPVCHKTANWLTTQMTVVCIVSPVSSIEACGYRSLGKLSHQSPVRMVTNLK